MKSSARLVFAGTSDYSGIKGCNLLISSRLVSPTVEQLVNHVSMFDFFEGKAIMGQQMRGENIDVSVWRIGIKGEEEEEEEEEEERRRGGEEEAGVPVIGRAVE